MEGRASRPWHSAGQPVFRVLRTAQYYNAAMAQGHVPLVTSRPALSALASEASEHIVAAAFYPDDLLTPTAVDHGHRRATGAQHARWTTVCMLQSCKAHLNSPTHPARQPLFDRPRLVSRGSRFDCATLAHQRHFATRVAAKPVTDSH